MRFDKQDEMRVVAYIQAVTQVVLNIATSGSQSPQDTDMCLKLIAATMSVLAEYLPDGTQRIKRAAADATRLVMTHGLGKMRATDLESLSRTMSGDANGGPERVYMNVKYLLSSRFTGDGDRSATTSADLVFYIMRAFVTNIKSEVLLDSGKLEELLQMIVQLKVERGHYKQWTSCIGAFMARMGGQRFFQLLPLRLIEFDLNSLSYAQDSRSWLIQLVPQYLKKDNTLLFFVQYFLPMILQLDKMRELEQQVSGSPIKIKKFETLLA